MTPISLHPTERPAGPNVNQTKCPLLRPRLSEPEGLAHTQPLRPWGGTPHRPEPFPACGAQVIPVCVSCHWFSKLDIWAVPSSAADLKSWGSSLFKEQFRFELLPDRGPRVGVGRWGFVVRLCPSPCYLLPLAFPLFANSKESMFSTSQRKSSQVYLKTRWVDVVCRFAVQRWAQDPALPPSPTLRFKLKHRSWKLLLQGGLYPT